MKLRKGPHILEAINVLIKYKKRMVKSLQQAYTFNLIRDISIIHEHFEDLPSYLIQEIVSK